MGGSIKLPPGAVLEDENELKLPPGATLETPASASQAPDLSAQNERIDQMQREAAAPPSGFFGRAGQALGIPTSAPEADAMQKSFTSPQGLAKRSVLGPIGGAAWDWASGQLIPGVKTAWREGREAGSNIGEGGPVGANVLKALSGAVEGGIGAIPFVGSPAVQMGKDIATGNYRGAAGGATGTLLPFAVPAAGDTAARVARGIAPGFSESSIGATWRNRLRGMEPGETMLQETKGLKPETYFPSVEQRLQEIGKPIEQVYTRSGSAGRVNTLQPVLDELDRQRAIADEGNRDDLVKAIDEEKVRISRTGLNVPPHKLWMLKRGVGDLASWKSLDPNMRGQLSIAEYGAMDAELDRVTPEATELNSRYSQLKNVQPRAEVTEAGAPLPQKLAKRAAAPTGALIGAGLGAIGGTAVGGPLGTIAGGLAGWMLPELYADPATQMAIGRGLWKLGGGERLGPPIIPAMGGPLTPGTPTPVMPHLPPLPPPSLPAGSLPLSPGVPGAPSITPPPLTPFPTPRPAGSLPLAGPLTPDMPAPVLPPIAPLSPPRPPGPLPLGAPLTEGMPAPELPPLEPLRTALPKAQAPMPFSGPLTESTPAPVPPPLAPLPEPAPPPIFARVGQAASTPSAAPAPGPAIGAVPRPAGPPPETLAIPGMEQAIAEQNARQGATEGQQLGAAFGQPKGSVSEAAGTMERESPLFGNREEVTGQKGMFGGEEKPPAQAKPEEGAPGALRPDGTPHVVPPEDDVVKVPIKALRIAPDRFQFKRDVGVTGAGSKLKASEEWDPAAAGSISVWRDPDNGVDYVVNGHHRYDHALRMGRDYISVRYIDAPNERAAMVRGAVQNIREGQGTAVDWAKIFRLAPEGAEEAARKIGITDNKVDTAVALAKLSDSLWEKVYRGEVSETIGKAIGSQVASPEGQRAALDMLESKGRDLSEAEATYAIRYAKAGETVQTEQTLFGPQEITQSLAIEKAQLAGDVMKLFSSEKKIFGTASRGSKAISERGVGEVDAEQAKLVARNATQARQVFDKLSDKAGPVGNALTEAAERLAHGGERTEIRDELYRRVIQAVAETLAKRTG